MKKLVCNTCGSDNMNSLFAKHEGDTCRQFGCFGSMAWMASKEAKALRKRKDADLAWQEFLSLFYAIKKEREKHGKSDTIEFYLPNLESARKFKELLS